MKAVVRWCVVVCALALLGCSSGPETRSAQAEQEGGEVSRSSSEQTRSGEARRSPAPRPIDWEAAREQSERVSESDLEAFALGVRALGEREDLLVEEGRDMETRSRAAGSPIEVIQIREETLAEMMEALEEVGLDIDGFLKAGEIIGSNPLLVERLGAYLEPQEIERFFGEGVLETPPGEP